MLKTKVKQAQQRQIFYKKYSSNIITPTLTLDPGPDVPVLSHHSPLGQCKKEPVFLPASPTLLVGPKYLKQVTQILSVR